MDYVRPYRQLEALRIVAALGIVTLHFSAGLLQGQAVLWPGAQSLELFVDTFFVISGFVIAASQGPLDTTAAYRGFVAARLMRLLPLHWLMTGMVMLVALGDPTPAAAPWLHDRACLVPTLLLVQATGLCTSLSLNFASWSVSAELVVYLLTPVLLIVAGRGMRGLAVTGLLIGALCLVDLSGQKPWYERTVDGGLLRALPAYLIGLSLFALRERLARIALPSVALSLGLIAFIVLAFAGLPEALLLPLAYLLPVLAIALDLQGRGDRVGAWIAPHGVKTYAIYMVHLPVVFAFAQIRSDDLRIAVPQLLLCLVTVFVIGSLCHRNVDRPLQRWLARLRKTRTRLSGAPDSEAVRPLPTQP